MKTVIIMVLILQAWKIDRWKWIVSKNIRMHRNWAYLTWKLFLNVIYMHKNGINRVNTLLWTLFDGVGNHRANVLSADYILYSCAINFNVPNWKTWALATPIVSRLKCFKIIKFRPFRILIPFDFKSELNIMNIMNQILQSIPCKQHKNSTYKRSSLWFFFCRKKNNSLLKSNSCQVLLTYWTSNAI